jgi:hypothetical protein
MTEFFENGYLQFHTISEQADDAVQSLTPDAWSNFLVLSEVLEGALATGSPPTRLMEDIDDDLFVLNGTALGSKERFICACRGRRILVASVIGSGGRASEREIEAAREALNEWSRVNYSRGPAV